MVVVTPIWCCLRQTEQIWYELLSVKLQRPSDGVISAPENSYLDKWKVRVAAVGQACTHIHTLKDLSHSSRAQNLWVLAEDFVILLEHERLQGLHSSLQGASLRPPPTHLPNSPGRLSGDSFLSLPGFCKGWAESPHRKELQNIKLLSYSLEGSPQQQGTLQLAVQSSDWKSFGVVLRGWWHSITGSWCLCLSHPFTMWAIKCLNLKVAVIALLIASVRPQPCLVLYVWAWHLLIS